MGKTGKWFKSFLTGKKDKPKEKCDNISSSNSSTPVPKEKRRWSFRRPTETRKEHNQSLASTSAHGFLETRIDPERHAVAVAVATAAAADAAVAAAQAAAAMVRLTSGPTGKSGGNGRILRRNGMIEEVAAIKIQSVFRSYLARKALCALKGLVKLQALVRGHLLRKQASATLRCMQALVAVQTRARLQRIKILEEEERSQCRTPQRQRSVRNSPQHPRFRHSNDNSTEENVKIVEVDTSMPKARHSYSPAGSHPERPLSSHSRGGAYHTSNHPKISPTASALTDMSPRTYSGRFDEFSFTTARSGGCSPAFGNYLKSGSCASDATKSPYGASQDYPLFPNYMANTESSRAKARSQSAPKSRPVDSFERSTSTSRRRVSLEGRNIPRGIKMQRSASQAGPTVSGFQYQYQYPWSVKLDKSSISLKDSECGSTSTVMTNASYYSTLPAQEFAMPRYIPLAFTGSWDKVGCLYLKSI